MRLREVCLDRQMEMTIKEIPSGWRRLLKIFGYKKIYLSERE